MLIPIIRPRRCLPEAHRTQPPRSPDARSCKVSARERAGAFPMRSCEGTVHGIAHRVKPDGGLRGAPVDDGVPPESFAATPTLGDEAARSRDLSFRRRRRVGLSPYGMLPRRMRNLPSAARGFSVSPKPAESSIRKLLPRRHKVSGVMDGAPRLQALKKTRMAPCRASIRLPFPTSPGKPGAPRHGRRAGTVSRVANSPRFRRCASCTQIRDEPENREPESYRANTFEATIPGLLGKSTIHPAGTR